MAQAKQQTKTHNVPYVFGWIASVVVALVVCLLTNFEVKYFWEFLQAHSSNEPTTRRKMFRTL